MANSPARSSVDVGSVIADTYIIEALIGRGGMGSVFLASHNRLPGKRVAIKLLHVDLDDASVITRFRREATIASQLDHPNIVRVDDFNVHDDGTPYLILEYLEGESLAQRLEKGPLPVEQVMSIMRMVGSAIAAAHQLGYVHRDLKPQNLFLVPTEIDGRLVEVAKVLDFGISKMRNSSTVKTQENTLLGTPQYMAPEQATGQHAAVDERTDIFALGAIVYEMLTGKPAFSGENIPAVVFRVVYDQPPPLAEAAPATPPDVIAAVEKAMQKNQDDRFPTIQAFIEALTGRPLVQRSGMISLAPRERPKAALDVYANTVDSGSAAKVPTAIANAKVPTAIANAKTVASQKGDEATPAPPPSRSRALVIGLALVCAAAIGAALFFAFRKPAEQPVASAVPPPVIAIDAAAAMDAAVAAVIADAEVAPDAKLAAVVTLDAPPAVEKPGDAGVKAKPHTIDRRTGDPLAWEWLDKAEAAFKAGNHDAARRHCNSVVDNSQTASGVQRSLALVMRGTIHCKEQRIGDAQADLRAIPIASYRATLVARCKAAGQPLQ